MFADNTLFILMLAAITLVIIVLFGLVTNMLIESKQRRKFQLGAIAGASRNAQQRCPYSFGYLSLLSRSQPIPDECFGCLLGIDCIKANPKPTKDETDNPEKHVTSAA